MGEQDKVRGAASAVKTWIVLGSANGSTNLGDECMWETAVTVLRESAGEVHVVTDGGAEWVPPIPDIVVLPYLHLSLRRGFWIPLRLRRFQVVRLLERLVSYPSRDNYARKAAERARFRPRRGVQQLWNRAVHDSEGVIVSGAGAITDDYAAHGIYAWSLACKWAHAAAKPVAFVGQGVGPVRKPQNQAAVGEMLRTAELLTVREDVSARVAEGLGVTSRAPVVHVTPDWALMAVPEPEDGEEARSLTEPLLGSEPYIAVCFHRRHSTRRSDLNALACLLGEIVQCAASRGLRTLYVPNMTAGGYSDDRRTANALLRRLPRNTRDRVRVLTRRTTPRVTRAILGGAAGVVSSRYHTMVFAFSEGTPCVGISFDPYYDQKLAGLSALFSVSQNVHRLGMPGLSGEMIFAELATQVPSISEEQVSERIKAPLREFLDMRKGGSRG